MEKLKLEQEVYILRFAHMEEDFYYDPASAGEAIPLLRTLIRMDAPRLLLLTGPNGCGKTALVHSLLVEEATAPCRSIREPDRWLLELLRRERETGAALPGEKLIIFEELWRLSGKTATREELLRRVRGLLSLGSSVLLMGEGSEPWLDMLPERCKTGAVSTARAEMRHPGPACRAAYGAAFARGLDLGLSPEELAGLAEEHQSIPALRAALLRAALCSRQAM